MDSLSLLQWLASPKLRHDARRYRTASDKARRLAAQPPQHFTQRDPGSSISPGHAVKGPKLCLPVSYFCAHGLILGATNSGKSSAALHLLGELSGEVRHNGLEIGIGLVDAKGELFDKLSRTLRPSPEPVVLDFSASQPVPYSLLKTRSGETDDGLVDRRMDVFSDLLGQDGHLSLRMTRMLRWFLALALEQNLAFPTLEYLFSYPDAAARFAKQSSNARLKSYFDSDFAREAKTTLPALSARLDVLLRNEKLRLSFGSRAFVDFKNSMDEGTPILVNCGGPGLSRSVRSLIQSLVMSDICQATFARANVARPFLWFLDEAQNLFAKSADVENIMTLLTMSRSFGTHLVLITQSLKAAIRHPAFAASLDTNFGWLLLFRCGLQDAQIIAPALPLSRPVRGRASSHRGSYLTPQQEAAQRLDEITKFPQQTGYLWVRAAGANAILMRSQTLIPNQNPSSPILSNHDLEEEAPNHIGSFACPGLKAPRTNHPRSSKGSAD